MSPRVSTFLDRVCRSQTAFTPNITLPILPTYLTLPPDGRNCLVTGLIVTCLELRPLPKLYQTTICLVFLRTPPAASPTTLHTVVGSSSHPLSPFLSYFLPSCLCPTADLLELGPPCTERASWRSGCIFFSSVPLAPTQEPGNLSTCLRLAHGQSLDKLFESAPPSWDLYSPIYRLAGLCMSSRANHGFHCSKTILPPSSTERSASPRYLASP